MDVNPAEALAMAERALARLEARGTVAEYFLRGGPELSLAFEPTSGRAVESVGEALRATCRVWTDGRCGVATADVGGEADLLRLAEEATARATQPGVPPPEAHPALLVEAPAATLSGERALRLARAMVAPLTARPGRFQAVTVRQGIPFTAVANTAGARALDFHSYERGLLRYETPAGALVDGVAGPLGAEALDPSPLAARLLAAWDALDGDGQPPAPDLPWTLRPLCAAPLLSGLAWLLRGDVAEKTPGLARAVGKKLFPKVLTLVDDTAGRRADDEGAPALPLTPIDEGRLAHFLHSAASARALGVASNGRGLRPTGDGAPSPSALAPRLQPGTAAPPADRNDFEARLETFTPMARPARILLRLAGWVVRGGERVHRIAPVERELPVLDTFRKLVAVGPDLAFFPALDGCGSPTLTFSPLSEPPVSR